MNPCASCKTGSRPPVADSRDKDMARLAFLEQFDQLGAEAAAEPAPPPGWQDGFEAGLAQARGEAEVEQAALGAALAQGLADLSFAPAEARLILLSQLRPLFSVLIERLLPALARESLMPRMIDLLTQAAEQDLARPLRLSVPQGQGAALREAAAGLPFDSFEIVEDPALGPGEARLAAAQGETHLDIDRLVEEATGALAALLDATERTASHG